MAEASNGSSTHGSWKPESVETVDRGCKLLGLERGGVAGDLRSEMGRQIIIVGERTDDCADDSDFFRRAAKLQRVGESGDEIGVGHVSNRLQA